MHKNLRWQLASIAGIAILWAGYSIIGTNQTVEQRLPAQFSQPDTASVRESEHIELYSAQSLRSASLAPAAPSLNPGLAAGEGSQDSREELTQNGGFEQGGSPVPQGWTWDRAQTGNQGTVDQDRTRFHSGHASVRLEPNKRNRENQPLAIAQVIPAGAYRGRRVEFSAYMSTQGDATAALGMLSIVRGRPENLVFAQPSRSSEWTQQQAVYEVPDDPSVQLVLACMVNGRSGAAWFDDVSVVLRGQARPDTAPADTGSEGSLKATIDIDVGTVIRQIPRTLYGTNVEWRWNANFLWLESSRRPHPDVVRLTRDLGVSLIRFPGGIYSDFYHWKDGVGPYEKRPEVVHEPGKDDRSRPNFGTEEALAFAREVGAELMITVNAGSGTPEEAAEWVRYVNRKGLRVRFWEVGNELYINDGSPTTKTVTVDPSTYAARFLRFAKAMRKADPRIKIGAIGGENQGRYAFVHYSNWNRIVLQKAADQIDFLAVHNAYAPALISDADKDLRTIYRAMLAAPTLIARNLSTLSRQIEEYAPGQASKIAIAVTEWGPFFHIDFRSPYVDHNKTLGSALFAASAFKAFLESPRTEIANFWLLNDVSVLGWIGSRNGDFPPTPEWIPTARYYVFQLYTQHFGDQLVQTRAVGPTYDSQAVGVLEAVNDVPYLDVVSSLSSDGRQLYIMAINKRFNRPVEASITIRGFKPAARGTAWTLTGTGIDANTGTTVIKVPGLPLGRQAEDAQNPRFSKGEPGEVTLSSSTVTEIEGKFTYRFPPHSITSLMLARREK